MKEIITTIMCLSFVTGTYEIVVEEQLGHPVYYTGGGLMCWRYDTYSSRNLHANEAYIRSIVSDEQWNDLVSNGIIECSIERDRFYEKALGIG